MGWPDAFGRCRTKHRRPVRRMWFDQAQRHLAASVVTRAGQAGWASGPPLSRLGPPVHPRDAGPRLPRRRLRRRTRAPAHAGRRDPVCPATRLRTVSPGAASNRSIPKAKVFAAYCATTIGGWEIVGRRVPRGTAMCTAAGMSSVSSCRARADSPHKTARGARAHTASRSACAVSGAAARRYTPRHSSSISPSVTKCAR